MSLSESIPLLSGPSEPSLFAPGESRTALERDILPRYLANARWFGGKARAPQKTLITDAVPVSGEPHAARLVFLEIQYADGAADYYLLPLKIAAPAAAESLAQAHPASILARFADGAVLFDALHDEAFRAAIFQLMAGGTFDGAHGRVAGIRGPILDEHPSAPASRVLAVEQSNSSIIYGQHIFLKLYRRLEEGVNPDAEILRFLGAQNFPHVPPFGGAIEYRGATGGTRVLALALGLVPNDGDAWSFTLRNLAQFYAALVAGDSSGAAARQEEYLSAASQLGTRTGEMHRALASDSSQPSFAPEPLTTADGATLATNLRMAIEQIETLLGERLDALDPATRELAKQLRDSAPGLIERADSLATLATAAAKTRTHGDYHLGQVLHGPRGFIIIDFEGEPLRSLAERRRKMSPFRDVAGMLRSFHYAAYAALEPLPESQQTLAADAEAWARAAQSAFLDAWFAATADAVFRDPHSPNERALLDAFLLEKALYEIRYEVNNRPTWLAIPIRGVLALLAPH